MLDALRGEAALRVVEEVSGDAVNIGSSFSRPAASVGTTYRRPLSNRPIPYGVDPVFLAGTVGAILGGVAELV